MKNNKSTYILAEMAASHEGNFELASFILENASKSKADGILFQIIDLDTYIVPRDAAYPIIKKIYLSQESWQKLIEKANSLNLEVWANVYDVKSLEFCRGKKIKGFKLHSSNLENEDLVKRVVGTKKELLLSIGGMDEKEIKRILKLIYSFNKKAKVVLMYGLQNFPTDPNGINLNFIKKLSDKLKVPFGYQDHSDPTLEASTFLPILFVANGASVIEKHITKDRGLKGIDYESALNPDEFLDFVKNIRIVDNMLARDKNEVSQDTLKYKEYKSLMKVVAKEEIKIGDKFSKDNLAIMRAKEGEVDGKELKNLFGKKSGYSYNKFDTIKKI